MRYFLVLHFALTKLLHFALACVASVSSPCRSKDRGTTVKDRAKNGSRFISRAAKTGLSLLRNQAKWKRLPRRLILRQILLHFALLLHFVAEQRLAKERVVECGKDAGSTVNPSAIGLPDQAFLSEVRIFDHSMPKMQSILYEAKKFKNQHHYQYCWAKNSVVYLRKDATARPIKIKGIDDLQRLADKYDQSCIVGNKMALCGTDYYNRTILKSYLTLMSILSNP